MLKAIDSPTAVASALPDDPFYIRISHKMREIITARGEQASLFPRAPTPIGAQGYVYALDEREIAAIEQWAEQAYREAIRWDRTAIGALQTQVRQATRERRNRGLIPDPGYAAVESERADRSARLAVGAVVVDINGESITIIEGFNSYRVIRDNGIYLDNLGARFDYVIGYVGVTGSGVRNFYTPGDLWSTDPKDTRPTYLKLVISNATTVGAS